MLTVISKALGFSGPPEQHPLMPRKISLSGNTVHFSIPENFSIDMPADDMIEAVDLKDKTVYKDHQKFTLIRRWWDFKDSGFFGKKLGTLMMSIYLKEAPDSLNINTLEPLDFIDIIVNDINTNKPKGIDDDPLMEYSDHFTAYKESFRNGIRWVKYIQGHVNGNEFSILFAVPITKIKFIVVEFITAPNDGVGIRGFIENHTLPFINNIMDSFMIDYEDGNPAKQAVLESSGPPLQQLIDEKVKQLELNSGD